jgi:hypothetical protein
MPLCFNAFRPFNRAGVAGQSHRTPLARVRRAATGFSGTWPYLRVRSELTGIADPLDYRLVESYWLGGGLGAGLDPQAFFDALLAIIGRVSCG